MLKLRDHDTQQAVAAGLKATISRPKDASATCPGLPPTTTSSLAPVAPAIHGRKQGLTAAASFGNDQQEDQDDSAQPGNLSAAFQLNTAALDADPLASSAAPAVAGSNSAALDSVSPAAASALTAADFIGNHAAAVDGQSALGEPTARLPVKGVQHKEVLASSSSIAAVSSSGEQSLVKWIQDASADPAANGSNAVLDSDGRPDSSLKSESAKKREQTGISAEARGQAEGQKEIGETQQEPLESPGRFATAQFALMQQRQQLMQAQRLQALQESGMTTQLPTRQLHKQLMQPSSTGWPGGSPPVCSGAALKFTAKHAQQASAGAEAVASSPVVLFSPGGPYSDKSSWYTAANMLQVRSSH